MGSLLCVILQKSPAFKTQQKPQTTLNPTKNHSCVVCFVGLLFLEGLTGKKSGPCGTSDRAGWVPVLVSSRGVC